MAAKRKSIPPVGEARGEATRAALIRAAPRSLRRQGLRGRLDARDRRGGGGQSSPSIAYHFGGKEGLRARLRRSCRRDDPRGARAGAARRPTGRAADARRRRARCSRGSSARSSRFSSCAREAQSIARFVVREMFEPSAAFERVYADAFAPMHARVCAVWAARDRRARPTATATRLAMFAMLGQILYFRIAPRVALRRMGWSDIGPREAEAIRAHAARASRRRARRRAQGGRHDPRNALCSIGFVASWLSACAPPAAAVVGYVEGEYVQSRRSTSPASSRSTCAAATG